MSATDEATRLEEEFLEARRRCEQERRHVTDAEFTELLEDFVGKMHRWWEFMQQERPT